MKTKSSIIVILLALILAFWFKCSTDSPNHRNLGSALFEKQTKARKIVVIDPTEKNDRESAKSTHEFDFGTEENRMNLEFEPLLSNKPAGLRIKLLEVMAFSNRRIEESKSVEKIAVVNLPEIQNLEIFATREFGKSDEQLLQQILEETIVREDIDLLLCADHYSEGNSPVLMWYSPEVDITDIVKQEFLNQMK